MSSSTLNLLCVLPKAMRQAAEEEQQEAEAKKLEEAKKREEAENPKCSVCTVGVEECSV